jgi:hypothetical protein
VTDTGLRPLCSLPGSGIPRADAQQRHNVARLNGAFARSNRRTAPKRLPPLPCRSEFVCLYYDHESRPQGQILSMPSSSLTPAAVTP